MAIPFLSSVDLNKNQVLNIVIENSVVTPSNPITGQMYFDTNYNTLYYFDGTNWIGAATVGAGDGLVASSSGGVTNLNVNVDGATLEINADTVRIKDGGVTTAKLGSNAVTTIKITDKNITFAKIQDMAVMTVLGSIVGGTPTEIPILNEADMTSNSATSLATQSSIKAYVDSRVSSLGSLIGGFDAAAATNLPGTGSTKKGDYWYVTVAGTVQSQVFEVGDVIVANKNAASATSPNDYIFLQSNRDQATTTQMGMVILASNTEVIAGVNATKAVTPASLAALTATDARRGLVELATNEETATGTDTQRAVTPAGLKYALQQVGNAFVGNIGDGVATAITVTHGLNTKDVIVEVFANANGQTVQVDTLRTTVNAVQLQFGANVVPAAAAYRVIVRPNVAV